MTKNQRVPILFNLPFQKGDILYNVLQSVDIPADMSATQEALPVDPRTQEASFPGVSFDLDQYDFGQYELPKWDEIDDFIKSEAMEGLIGPDPLWPGPLDPREMVESAFSSSSSSVTGDSTGGNQQESNQVRAHLATFVFKMAKQLCN
jgi:hypothetical protein